MDSTDCFENASVPLLLNRFKHMICVTVQIHKVEGNRWREIDKDFVLLHMYYDTVDKETKLIAASGIKLIVKGFVITSDLQLARPTKKFLHFVSTLYGRSEMYGFGFQSVIDLEKFMRQFNIVFRRLHGLSSAIAIQLEPARRHPSVASTNSQPLYPSLPSATSSNFFGEPDSTQKSQETSKKSTDAVPLFSLEDLRWWKPRTTGTAASEVQLLEKELQGMSFASDTLATAPNIEPIISMSGETSTDTKSIFQHTAGSATSRADSVSRNAGEMGIQPLSGSTTAYRPYQLWDATPWNHLIDQTVTPQIFLGPTFDSTETMPPP